MKRLQKGDQVPENFTGGGHITASPELGIICQTRTFSKIIECSHFHVYFGEFLPNYASKSTNVVRN